MQHQPNPIPTVDPLAELRSIAEIATEGLRSLQRGTAITGTSALVRIQARAKDAVRWAATDALTDAIRSDLEDTVGQDR